MIWERLTTMEHRRDEPYDLLPGDHQTSPKLSGERGNARIPAALTHLEEPPMDGHAIALLRAVNAGGGGSRTSEPRPAARTRR